MERVIDPVQRRGSAPASVRPFIRRLQLCTALFVAVGSAVTPARAEESPSAWSWLWVNGSSPGEPSTGKLVTLYSLYGFAIGSLALSGVGYYSAFEAKDATREFRADNTNPGPCFDLTSQSCAELERLRADERANLKLGALGLASAGVFLLSGVVIAHQWDNVLDNVQPTLSAGAGGAEFGLRWVF
jgi:hypothetical protein